MTATQNGNRVRNLLPADWTDVDGLMDQFFGAGGRNTFAWRTPASVWEADGKVHLELDVPGVSRDDVQLTFKKGALAISVERRAPEGERRNWHNERGFGKATRTLVLPDTLDPESIEAELTAGVLHVTIAKRPEAQPKRIEIKTA